MKNLTTFVNGRLRASRGLAILFLCLALPWTARAGQAGDDEKNTPLPYQPFTDAEIKAALQKPVTVTECIRIALAKSIELKIASGDLQRSEANHAGSYSRFLPLFSVEGSRENSTVEEPDAAARFTESQFNNNATVIGKASLFLPLGTSLQFSNDLLRTAAFPDSALNTKQRDRGYSLNLTQPLLRGAGPTLGRSDFILTGYDEQIQRRNLENTKLQTVFSVRQIFYDALAKQEFVKVNRAALKSDSVLVKASEALMVAKMATRRDVLSAEIRYSDDSASLIKSQTEYQRVLDDLKNAMGIPIETSIVLDAANFEYVAINLDESLLIRQAVENNPVLHSAELAVRRNKVSRTVAKNSLLPQLDFVASYSSNLSTDLIGNKDLSRTGGWQARLNLSYAFLSRDASARAENAEIAVSQQEDRLQILQRQIIVNVRDIVRSAYTSAAELQAIKRGIEAGQEKLDFAKTMFNLGRASNFDVTDAQEFLLVAQSKYLSKLANYYRQFALLESLTGKPVTQ